jgi:hypothetical protein
MSSHFLRSPGRKALQGLDDPRTRASFCYLHGAQHSPPHWLLQIDNCCMSTGSAERPVAKPRGTAQRVRVIIFRVLATLAGLFFVVAVVLMASAPWVLLQPDQDVRTELNRWFLTVAGSVDAITRVSCSRLRSSRAGRSWSSSW